MMQIQPGSGPAGQGKTNKVLLHSLNELSIGTANMKGGDLQTEVASIQGPQEPAERSNMGVTQLLEQQEDILNQRHSEVNVGQPIVERVIEEAKNTQ